MSDTVTEPFVVSETERAPCFAPVEEGKNVTLKVAD